MISICSIVKDEFRELRLEDIRHQHVSFEAFKTVANLYDSSVDFEHCTLEWDGQSIKDEGDFGHTIGVQSVRLRQRGSRNLILFEIRGT